MMKHVKLLLFILLTITVSATPLSVTAGSKVEKQRQAKQKKQAKKDAKQKIKDNKKFYKKVQKPAFKQQKANNKKAQEQAKKDRKQAKKNLKQAQKEADKFSKARVKARAALMKQKAQVEAAMTKYDKNPSPKNLKARDKLMNSYNNSYNNYQQGPKQQSLNKDAALRQAKQNFANKDRGYKTTLEDGATIARNKVQAKLAVNNVQSVSNGLYNVQPTISNLSIRDVPPPRSTASSLSASSRSSRSSSLKPMYDRVPPLQMNNYGSPQDALIF